MTRNYEQVKEKKDWVEQRLEEMHKEMDAFNVRRGEDKLMEGRSFSKWRQRHNRDSENLSQAEGRVSRNRFLRESVRDENVNTSKSRSSGRRFEIRDSHTQS